MDNDLDSWEYEDLEDSMPELAIWDDIDAEDEDFLDNEEE